MYAECIWKVIAGRYLSDAVLAVYCVEIESNPWGCHQHLSWKN